MYRRILVPTDGTERSVHALSSVKKTTFNSEVLRPMLRAWFSSKKVTIRSFHFSNRIAIEIKPIAASWIISSGAMARILPRIIV